MRLTVAVAVACLSIGGVMAAEPVQASIKRFTNIPAQPLGAALQSLARERDFQVLYRTELVGETTTQGATGELTADEALVRLLSGTGLGFEYLDENTVRIVPVAPAPARTKTDLADDAISGDAGFREEASFWSRLRLAQADTSRLASQDADAGERTEEKGALTEVVVTAQKRAERLRDVPISVSVVSGAALDGSSLNVAETLNRVPGVVTNYNPVGGGVNLTVRGVRGLAGSSPIAYYVDSVPFGLVNSSFAPDAGTYDLDRIEVLRGPQGTLYGANAQNGVVRILTRDANLNELETKARATLSSTDSGVGNYRGDLAVNVPLVPGKLAARAVLGYQSLGGWIDRQNENNANGTTERNARLKLNAQPLDTLSIGLSAWLSRSDADAPSVARDDGRNASLVEEPMETNFDTYGLKVDYDFSSFSLSSRTSYFKYDHTSHIDYAAFGLPNTILRTTADAEVFSQEVYVNSLSRGPWRWTAGGSYRDAKDSLFQLRRQYVAPADQSNTSESFAIFGELGYRFLDGRLELTAGLRYFEDEVGVDELSRRLPLAPGEQLIHRKDSFDALSPRLVLSWHATEQAMVYASYAEGFRSGFPQFPAVISVAPQLGPVDPDTLKNYEVGAKGSFLDGRLSVDASLFFIDWSDVQQSLTVDASTPSNPGMFVAAAVNAASASGMGFEMALATQPVRGLNLGASFSWNDLTLDEDVFSGGVLLFNKGDRLNASPEYTVGASAEYGWPLGQSGLTGLFAVSGNYTSILSSRAIRGQVSVADGDPILIGRASFAVQSPSRWLTTLFVDNFGNEKGSPGWLVFGFEDWKERVRPRTYGVQVEYHF